MKIGILGDIHGNAAALRAVLSSASDLGVKLFLNTGDFVGYYYHPKDVFDCLENLEMHAVLGNHDEMLLHAKEENTVSAKITRKYGHGLERALEQLDQANWAYLRCLPRTKNLVINGTRFSLCHGSPWDTNTYIYPDAKQNLLEKIVESKEFDAQVVVLGHTHYQKVWRIGKALIVNPGSVGQPRDREPGAAWAMFNTQSGKVSLHRETYDWFSVASEASLADPDLPYLQEVLTRQ